MYPRCVVPGCNAPSNALGHRFPTRVALAEEWRAIINSPRLVNVPAYRLSNYRVCRRHFANYNYSEGLKRRRLQRNSVPSRHLNDNYPIEFGEEQNVDNAAADSHADVDESNVDQPVINSNPGVKEEVQFVEIKEIDEKECLKAIQKVVTEMMKSNSMNVKQEPSKSLLEHEHPDDNDQIIKDEHQQLLAKVTQLEEELQRTQEALRTSEFTLQETNNMLMKNEALLETANNMIRSYEFCLESANNLIRSHEHRLEDANDVLRSGFFHRWSKLNGKQKKFLEVQLINMSSDEFETLSSN